VRPPGDLLGRPGGASPEGRRPAAGGLRLVALLPEHTVQSRFSLYHRAVNRLQKIVVEAKSLPCADCGGQYGYWVMHLDHRPGVEKLFNVGTAYSSTRSKSDRFGRGEITEQMLLDEIAKCDVVCANCHHDRTYRRFHPAD
jgi:hypothetical protein